MRAVILSIVLTFALSGMMGAQSPAPVTVPAATPDVSVKESPKSSSPESTKAVLKVLEEMKAANAEMLRKQEAMLLQLDEMEKTAEQIKTFTKRS